MDYQILLIALISTTLLIVIGGFILIIGIYRSNQKAVTGSTLVTSPHPYDTVITRLNFSESLEPDRFAHVSNELLLKDISREFASGLTDGTVIGIQGLVLTKSSVEMTVSASKHGQQLLREGKAIIPRHFSGKALPLLTDPKTGKIIEQMKGVPTAQILSKVGAMSAMIIGAAHLIASADISKKLTIIDSKINLLLAYRRIEQAAKLEKIYTVAKELVSGPLNERRMFELWRLRADLRELRHIWRNELHHHLNVIDDPNSVFWLQKFFTRTISTDRNVQNKITEGQLQLCLIEYSLRLDLVISYVSGTIHLFEKTLDDELHELEKVIKLLESKSKFISGKYPDLTVEPTVKSAVALIEAYKTLLPEVTSFQKSEYSIQILNNE